MAGMGVRFILGGIFGGDKAAKKAAKEARKREEERQRNIRQGMAQIASIFEGVPTQLATEFNPGQQLFFEDGTLFDPTTFLEKNPDFELPKSESAPVAAPQRQRFGGRGSELPVRAAQSSGEHGSEHPIASGGDLFAPPSAREIAEALIAQGRLFTGEQREGGFDDSFFDARSQAFTDFAMPELDRQFEEARQDLLFALARGGNLQSSTATNRFEDLTRRRTQREAEIGDRAQDAAQQARADIERQRSALEQQLLATANPEAAANAAIRQAEILSAPPTFQPIGELFANITQGLALAAANPRNNFQGLGPTLFGGGSGGGGGSLRVVN